MSTRWDRTNVSPAQWNPATNRNRPVAWTIVRGHIPPETCWRRAEIARAASRKRDECPAPAFPSSQANDLFHTLPSRDRRREPNPKWAYELRWSHIRWVL